MSAISPRWVDETYVKVSGSRRIIYRAVDQYGQVIDVFAGKKGDLEAATALFARAMGFHGEPAGITTDRAHSQDSVGLVSMHVLDSASPQHSARPGW